MAVVNRTFAERFFPGESPLGRQLELRRIDSAADEPVQVVGVVADHRVLPPSEPIEPVLYVPFRQRPYSRLMVLARSQVPVGEAFLRELHAAHPDVAVIDLLPLAEQIRRATADQRMNADLAGGFGGFGLLLAALGIFSVASYGVARRGRELGIRMAVGADAGRIRRLVLGEMGVLVLAGLVLGMAGAVAFNKVLASLLLGVTPHDPATAVTMLLLLAAVALLAAWLPARRLPRGAEPEPASRPG